MASNQNSVPPLEKRLQAFEHFQELLRVGGMARRTIVTLVSKRFGVTESTVYQWWKGGSPLGDRAGRIVATEHLPYVIGALMGDGCIYFWRNTYQVWLLGEREFASKFALRLSQCLPDGRKVKPYPYRNRNVWFVKIQNAELYFLVKYVRQDRSFLSDMLSKGSMASIPLGFVEGFFDAEGCVKIINDRARKIPKICLDITNTDLQLQELARRLLKEVLGIESKLLSQKDVRSNRKTAYHLRIYKKNDVRIFLQNIQTVKMKDGKEMHVTKWLEKENWKRKDATF